MKYIEPPVRAQRKKKKKKNLNLIKLQDLTIILQEKWVIGKHVKQYPKM